MCTYEAGVYVRHCFRGSVLMSLFTSIVIYDNLLTTRHMLSNIALDDICHVLVEQCNICNISFQLYNRNHINNSANERCLYN